jgi:hypothetical protein
MLIRSSWLSFSVPSPISLLPVLWVTLALSSNLNPQRSLWVLIITYGLLQVTAHGYSNYFSKSVKRWYLFPVAAALHALAIISGLLYVSPEFALLAVLYGTTGLIHGIFCRQEKKAEAHSLSAFANGFLLFMLLFEGINKFGWHQTLVGRNMILGLLFTLTLWVLLPTDRIRTSEVHGIIVKTYLTIILYLAIMLAGFLFLWYYRLDRYTPLLTAVSAAGGLLLYMRFGSGQLHEQLCRKRVHLVLIWAITLEVNAFAFYLFADHTQILQLADQL